MTKTYTIQTKLWLYAGKAAWHFVTVPTDIAEDIDYYFENVKGGFGSVPVTVTIGTSTWKTSIFPDKKSHTFMLPVKASVRKKEAIADGDIVDLSLEVRS